MISTIRLYILSGALSLSVFLLFMLPAQAQQTLGGITGTVVDNSGGSVQEYQSGCFRSGCE
jgi:hypothetical protein